jgi:hypothetical protein
MIMLGSAPNPESFQNQSIGPGSSPTANEQLCVRVPLREYEVMVQAVAALADIRRGDKIVVDKAKFDELLKVSKKVEAMLGKLDDAGEAREAA